MTRLYLFIILSTITLAGSSALATTVSGTSYAITIQDPPTSVIKVRMALPGGDVIEFKGLTANFKNHNKLPNGTYQYELIGPLTEVDSNPKAMYREANPAVGRQRTRLQNPIGVIESGDFRILNGLVIDTRAQNERRIQ